MAKDREKRERVSRAVKKSDKRTDAATTLHGPGLTALADAILTTPEKRGK